MLHAARHQFGSGASTTETLLSRCLAELAAIGVAPNQCAALLAKLAANELNVVVLGEFKRGKSTLINALLGADILPTGVVPLTSVNTIVRYGDETKIRVVHQDGNTRELAAGELRAYVTEQGNPRNEKQVREIIIGHPSSWLDGGVSIVDTPGIGSVYRHNTDVAYAYLTKADAAIFVLSADQPIGEEERAFLGRIRKHAAKIFFLLNKTDIMSQSELKEVVDFTSHVLREALGTDVQVFPVSARLAIEGKIGRSDTLEWKSGISMFMEALKRFLLEDKTAVLTASLASNALRLVAQAKLNGELEVRALSEPLERLQEKIAAFRGRKKEVLITRSEYGLLVGAQIGELLKEVIEPDLEAFKGPLAVRMGEQLARYFGDCRHLSSSELEQALEDYVKESIRSAFDAWRSEEEAKLSSKFTKVCQRFESRVNDVVDDLSRYSSELFGVPFQPIKVSSRWETESALYYKFWNEPVSLQILSSSLIRTLPKVVSGRLLLRKAQRAAMESIDTQAGRVRYDFAQRVEASMRRFKESMLGAIDATVQGLEDALQRAVELSRQSAVTAQDRIHVIVERRRALCDIEHRLEQVLGATHFA